jgi:LeuA allosteric (dimerisation) domain
MWKNIEITPEIQDWDALASIAIDVSSEFDDVLIGNTQEDRIFSHPGNDILIDYHSQVATNCKYPLLEQVDSGSLRDRFGNWSLYDSAGNDISGESGGDILLGESRNNTIDSNYDRSYNDEENDYQLDLDPDDSETERAIEKKVLLDADIILDVLLDRKCPTLEDSVATFDLVSSKLVKGYIASSDFEQIVSLAQRLLNPENASRIEQKLLNFLAVCEVDSQLLRETSQMSLPKFKNTIQLACAVRYNIDAIVTVNSEDFWGDENYHPDINVFTPSQFLNNYYGLDIGESVNDECEELREKLEKDLEADCMVNEEILEQKLSLGTGWVVDSWIVRSDQNNFTEASVILRNPETSDRHSAFVRGQGPIEASCKALDKLVKQLFDEAPEYSFKDFVTRNVSDEGAAATVEATVIVKCDDLIYISDYTHKSIIQAVFYAYVKSVDKILRSEAPKKTDQAVSNFVDRWKSAKRLP